MVMRWLQRRKPTFKVGWRFHKEEAEKTTKKHGYLTDEKGEKREHSEIKKMVK